MKTLLLPIIFILFIALIVSFWLYPQFAPFLYVIVLFCSIALALLSIFQTHKHTQNARTKISKDILIFLVTLLLILFIGGVVGMLVNFYVSNLYGAVIGFVCAVLVSFAVGYGVKKRCNTA